MINVQQTLTSKVPTIAKMPKLFQIPIVATVRALVHEHDINRFIEDNSHLDAFDFIEKTLEYFNFSYKTIQSQIENIPKTGRVVIIANHPLGALDALSLIDMVKNIRQDIKVVANSILKEIEPIKDILIEVDTFDKKVSKEAIKSVYKSLENDEAVIIFPSGEVSRARANGIKDTKWNSGFLKFATKTQSPILPIYIKAKNSALFYTISSINKGLSTLLLPHEMFKKRNKTLEFKIGKLIPYKSYANLDVDSKTKVKLFKKHLYKIAKGKKGIFKGVKSIAHPIDRKLLKDELKDAKLLGETNDGKKIYLYDFENKSNLLKEIGRLRELTFRKVEEGTGKKRDNDEYDIYYKHIILWDEEQLEIVGSYRIGESNYIYENFGVDGFYTNTLFRFNKEFLPYLNNSIELGRSFVQPKYWGSRALDYLWQGIGAYLKEHPNIKYMFGPVSISSALPKDAINLIVYYYDLYYGDRSQLVLPVLPFKFNIEEISELQKIFKGNDEKEDFIILKRQLNYYNATVPTLYKQYTDLCENGGVKFLGFNIDRDFNDCIDGMILVDIDKIKPKKRQRYIK